MDTYMSSSDIKTGQGPNGMREIFKGLVMIFEKKKITDKNI